MTEAAWRIHNDSAAEGVQQDTTNDRKEKVFGNVFSFLKRKARAHQLQQDIKTCVSGRIKRGGLLRAVGEAVCSRQCLSAREYLAMLPARQRRDCHLGTEIFKIDAEGEI